MAHSPEFKAEVVAAVAAGMTWAEAAKEFGVSKGSLTTWVKDARKSVGEPVYGEPVPGLADAWSEPLSREAKKARFDAALEKFLLGSIDMMVAWQEFCSDRSKLETQPGFVHELGKTVLERADRMVSILGSGNRAED